MSDIYVVGVGMTPFGRMLDIDMKTLSRSAVDAALGDAGLQKSDIEAAFFANASQGHMERQHMIRGEILLREMGIGGVPVVNVENACASGSTAFNLAVTFLKAGEGDVALALGAEKMFSTDRKLMFEAFDSAWDVSRDGEIRDRLLALGEGVEVPEGTTSDKPYSVFMDVYAAFCRQHMRRYGTTQRQIAAVAAKNHAHSVHNPLAQFRDAMSVEQVMAAPPITYPLTLPMCSPISDGAAAVVVCSEAGLRKLGVAGRAVKVLASVILTGVEHDPETREQGIGYRAAQRAYERAGIGPNAVDVAEVHDATAMGELLNVEALGLVPFGLAGPAAERGDFTIGGRVPVNPSGGLESKGHPIAATGIANIWEVAIHLRNEAGDRQIEGAKVGLAHVIGLGSACGVHILEKAAV